MTKSFRRGGSRWIQLGLAAAAVAWAAGCGSAPDAGASAPCRDGSVLEASSRVDAARLWVALLAASKTDHVDDATAREIDARSAALEPAASGARACGGVGAATAALVSEPFRCSDDCRTTAEDLARAVGDAGVARLRTLAGDDAIVRAIAGGDVDAILAAIGEAVGADAAERAIAMVPGLRALARRAADCRDFRARSCGGPGGPAAAAGLSGSWRWTFASHVPSSGGYTPTRTRTEIRVDFDLTARSVGADGVVALEGPARVDVVDDQGVIQNVLIPGGTDCPMSWHVTGPHTLDVTARGGLDPATGRVTVEPGSFVFTETRSSMDCRTPATETPVPVAIPFDGCDGLLVGGALHEEHEGRHPPRGPLASITVVDRDADACDLVAR